MAGVLPSRAAVRSIAWVTLRLAAVLVSKASSSWSAQAASTVADQARKSLAVKSPPAPSPRQALTSPRGGRARRLAGVGVGGARGDVALHALLVDVLEQLLPWQVLDAAHEGGEAAVLQRDLVPLAGLAAEAEA